VSVTRMPRSDTEEYSVMLSLEMTPCASCVPFNATEDDRGKAFVTCA
jgi:hypothetical protein